MYTLLFSFERLCLVKRWQESFALSTVTVILFWSFTFVPHWILFVSVSPATSEQMVLSTKQRLYCCLWLWIFQWTIRFRSICCLIFFFTHVNHTWTCFVPRFAYAVINVTCGWKTLCRPMNFAKTKEQHEELKLDDFTSAVKILQVNCGARTSIMYNKHINRFDSWLLLLCFTKTYISSVTTMKKLHVSNTGWVGFPLYSWLTFSQVVRIDASVVVS